MEFLVLCSKRGVPPEKISGFLLGLGLDAETVNRWMDVLKREMAGIPERTVSQNYAPAPVGRPAGTERANLDGGTNTDFVLPDLDATKTKLREALENIDEQSIEVSLEISEKDLKRAQEQADRSDRQTVDAPPSMLVSAAPDSIPSIPDSPRVQLEKSRPKKRKSRHQERKLLGTPQARLAAFAAAVLITWLLSDAGWFPGGSARHSTLPANDVVAHEEPVLRPPPDSAPVAVVAPQPPPEKPSEAKAPEYPDPWAVPTAQPDPERAPSSQKPPNHRPKRLKRQRNY